MATAAVALALPGAASAATPHGLGLLKAPPKTASAAALRAVKRLAASVPASVDLTPYAPPAGNQGSVNSCAAWATDYTAMGYWENKQGISGGVLAPMFTYSQLVGGQNVGTYIDDHLRIAKQTGVDSHADYTQGDYDYTSLPTAHEVSNAAHWKISSYTDLPIQQSASSTVTQQSVMGALANGTPVVVGIPVWNNFFSVAGTNHGYYAGPSGSFAGYHAVTALGYDSTGLRIENQWGTGWGDRGFATLSWSFVNTYVFQATSVGQLVPPAPAPVVTVSPVVTGTAARGVTLTASAGTWSNSPTSYAYQWQRDPGTGWVNIAGATTTSYTPQLTDEGAKVRIRVIATNSGGSGASYSTGAVVAKALPVLTASPTVSGTATRGSVLRATTGTWTGAGNTYAYQWQRDPGTGWVNIAGAASTSYTLQSADAGAQVRIRVIATNPDGASAAYARGVGPVG